MTMETTLCAATLVTFNRLPGNKHEKLCDTRSKVGLQSKTGDCVDPHQFEIAAATCEKQVALPVQVAMCQPGQLQPGGGAGRALMLTKVILQSCLVSFVRRPYYQNRARARREFAWQIRCRLSSNPSDIHVSEHR